MLLNEYEKSFPVLCAHLKRAKASGHVGQAYMLVGDDMDFLEGFAGAWAMTAACTSPLPDGSPCGGCKACKAFAAGSYPELYKVRPQSKSRQILVDDMHAFQHQMGLSSAPGFLKTGMIIEAERLGDPAQNAFLKTLEEPPAGTMLLLLTMNPRKLLPTIRSRCQTLSLLRNRQDYSELAKAGLFKALALLHRRAGASAGLRAAAAIGDILAGCEARAQENARSMKAEMDEGVDDPKLKKQIDDENAARIQAEYVRQRDNVTGAMQAWFLQRILIAGGARKELLPAPGMLEGVELTPPSMEESSQDLHFVDEFLRSVASNVDIRLALDVLCLQITDKRSWGAPARPGNGG